MLKRAIMKMRRYKEGPAEIDLVGTLTRLIIETSRGDQCTFTIELEPDQALSTEQALRAQLKKFCDTIASSGRGPGTILPTCKTCGNDKCPAYDGEDETPKPGETTHLCPPGDSALTPCCGKSPFELPKTDRLTEDPKLVTCHARKEIKKE